MTSPTRSRTRLRRSPSASTSATRSAGAPLTDMVELTLFDPSSRAVPTPTLMENSAPGNSSATPSRRRRRPALELGDLDMRIARDGTWFYRGSPINRMPLVKLFASVLRRERDGSYWLVTPAERGRVTVEDAPFIAVAVDRQGEGRAQRLIFRTNLDEIVTARSEEHTSELQSPYDIVCRLLLEKKK